MQVIDYAAVLQQTAADGLRCVYPNSGAFAPQGMHDIVGWIGPDDPTIRPDLRARLFRVAEPYPQMLAKRFIDAWQRLDSPAAWLLPKSHWAYELDHAHQDWLVAALSGKGIDTATLSQHTDAPALAFGQNEVDALSGLVELLFSHLKTSDYTLLLPGRRLVATIHHHQQLWWQTADPAVLALLSALS